MLNNLKRRALTLLLSLAMIITYMPTSMIAYAVDGDEDQVQVEQQVEAEKPAEDVEAPKAEQPEEKTSDEVKSEEAKSEEVAPPAEKKASEEVAKPADEEVKAEAKAEAEDKEPLIFKKDLETVAVKVTAPADAFSEKVELVVKQLDKTNKEDKKAFEEAEKALAENKQTYDGILAFDIHFEDGKGKEVEPDGAVSVEMTAKKEALKGVDPKTIDADSIQVTHIGSDETVVVADNVDEKVEGTVEVQTTKKAVEKIGAEFEVDGFSTYTITWTEGEVEKSATIHWGTMGDDRFEEIKSTTTVDSTASSVDLAVNIDGYYYVGATYKAPGTTDALAMTSSTIKKDDGAWTAQVNVVVDDDTVTEQTVKLDDKSDIYVIYASKGGGGYNPPGPPPATLDNIKPETEKTVEPNGDGTYKIRLDVTGHATEDTKQGANVIVMLDMTYSMRQNDMNGTRIAAAKSALLTLIDALDPGYDAEHPDKNLVNFTLATFGNTMTTDTELSWTQNRTAMENAVRALSNSPGAMGTNWQGGLGGAESIAEAANRNPNLNKNPTYVIFVTDGAPNCWQGHTSSSTGNDLDPAALPYAQTAANSLTGDAILYGVFCGPASGYNNLANLVTNAHGADTINGTNQTDLEAAFSKIAGHIVEGMAASNVTVDDGIPSLSSVSANVTAGEASGFKYYIKPAGGEEKEWVEGTLGDNDPGAPGATYDKTNGVTWDLGEAGTLQEGWVYSVAFDVWPSQKAYDTIADLNNDVITMTQDELDAAGIGKNADGSYYLLTNTHLNTTFEDPTGHVYDIEEEAVSEEMALPTETITVRKDWSKIIHPDESQYQRIIFYLTVDGKYYQMDGTTSSTLDPDKAYAMPLPHGAVTDPKSWEDNVFIAPGFMKGGEILETGHKYSLEETVEDENPYEYEFTPQTVRPMVINGTLTYLVLEDKYNKAKDGDTRYVLDDAKGTYREATGEDTENVYYVDSGSDGELVGTNRKTAELDITKNVIDKKNVKNGPDTIDESFTYKVTLKVPDDSDPCGIMGYEYVPRLDDPYPSTDPTKPRYKIYGYQTGDDDKGYDDDVAKFNNKVYGAWNTQMFKYFVQTDVIGGKTVVRKDENGNFIWLSDAVDGYHEATIYMTLSHDEVIRFTNLPAGTKYTIEELYANKYDSDSGSAGRETVSGSSNLAEQGYTNVTAQTKNGSATVSKDGKTIEGEIDYLDKRYYNQFTNKRTAVADASLIVKKELVGYNWLGDNTKERYYFVLTAGDHVYADGTSGKSPMPNNSTRWLSSSTEDNEPLEYNFGNIRYTEAGEYTYTLKETAPADMDQQYVRENVYYDAVEKTITVKVEANDEGDLEVTNITGQDTTFDNEKASGTTTFSNKWNLTEVKATKAWKNADGSTKAPDGASVAFTLYAGDDKTDYTVTLDGAPDTTVPTTAGGYESVAWTATFVNLPKYDEEGNEIVYTIAETGTWSGYTASPEDPVADGGTITNTQAVKSINGTKTWRDGNGDGRPNSITIKIVGTIKDGTETVSEITKTIEPGSTADKDVTANVDENDPNKWIFTVSNLLAFDESGNPIAYSIAEVAVEGYSVTQNGNDLINTKLIDIEATKVWNDANNQDGKRPESVTFELYAGNSSTGKTITLDGTPDEEGEATAWHATFKDVPEYSETNTKIVYTVKEVGETNGKIDGLGDAKYDVKYDGFTITNSYTPETTEIEAEKVWDDNNNQDGKRDRARRSRVMQQATH